MSLCFLSINHERHFYIKKVVLRHFYILDSGDPTAIVRGKVLQDGTFDGIIHSIKLDNTYFVEPTSKYPELHTTDLQIIYR